MTEFIAKVQSHMNTAHPDCPPVFKKSATRMCPSGVPCTSDRCEKSEQCLGGDYDAIAAGCTYE